MRRQDPSAVPEPIRSAVESSLSSRTGREVRVESARRVGGGCISPGARVDTKAGPVFVKWADPGDAPRGFFAEEARSLRALASAAAVRVPRVLDSAADWLLLEWLEPGAARAETWAVLGHGLAALHRTRSDAFGWPADNYIGSLAQANGRAPDWASFWRDRRIGPQWEEARGRGFFGPSDERAFNGLGSALDDLLAAGGVDGASLLHGDLWGGNVHTIVTGEAALIDPSSYFGHREVDLAMARLFGGFESTFFDAYEEAWPLEAGARERQAIYQLYYLLVHVNLFGAGYVDRCRSVLRPFG